MAGGCDSALPSRSWHPNLASRTVRLRRPVALDPRDPTPDPTPPDGTDVDPSQPQPVPSAPAPPPQHWQLSLTANTNLGPDVDRDSLVTLLRETNTSGRHFASASDNSVDRWVIHEEEMPNV